MIVDSSALIALLLHAPGWESIAEALTRRPNPAIGAPTLTETAIVLLTKGAPPSLLPALLRRAGIEVVAFTERHADLAADAYARYGRGRHPASLNYGDCLTYAVARMAAAPLLFVGNDFSQTDLEPVLT
ncbi:MAG: type II toxin-antitoxin system VapC family toxin [Trueperaceae bacterium]|nr:MAG: type II toxin-antitoxin system VapC family toxin [Trueperaceae bacterium]